MINKAFTLLIFIFPVLALQAQDQDLLNKDFHKLRREALRKEMPENSVAILFSAPERVRSNDVNYLYHQQPDFYYFSGFREPNSVLFLFKNPISFKGVNASEIIFVQPREPKKETWTGKRLGAEGVKEQLGLNAFINEELKDFNPDFSKFDKILFGEIPKGIVDEKDDKYDLAELFEIVKDKTGYPNKNTNISQFNKIVAPIRQQKQPEELALLKKAVDITCLGMKEMMQTIEPGMSEYSTQSIVEFMFTAHGAEYPGYPSICGAGENSCILHYESNRKKLNSGDLQLCDVGAEYHGYSADVTRTVPVNGKFSEEQKIIYNIVLEAQQAGINECQPGKNFRDPTMAAFKVVGQRLKELGLIKNELQVAKYLPHGISHYIGLDVHDIGTYGELKEGDVLTVEPGIYIPEGSDCDKKWWNIGIRIEDDIQITKTGNINLSEAAPRKIEEIETLMGEKGKLKDYLK